MQRRFFFAGPTVLLAAAILLWATPTLSRVIADPGPDDESTTTVPTAPPSGDTCATMVHFFAKDVTGHKFGPAVTEEVNAAQAELRHRLCSDPALAVALQEDATDSFSSPDERVSKTVGLIQNPDAWRLTVLAVTNAVAQGNPRVETMSGPYKTMYMVSEGRQIPEVFNASPDKPTFSVLAFDTPQGVRYLKLDCGFQPVRKSFPPAVPPRRTQPPSRTQPPKVPTPPTTVVKPPTTVPPTVTTQPPATTAPPSTTVPPSTTTTWKCDKGWHLVGGVWVCGGGGAPGTPPYQPPSTLPPTPGFNPATTVPGSTIPPGATPPVSFAPTPPPEAPVTTDPPAQGDPCQSASPPAFC